MSVTAEPVAPTLGINLNIPFTVIGITLFAYYFWKKTSKRLKDIENLPGPAISYSELLMKAITNEPKDILKFAVQKAIGYNKLAKAFVGNKLFVFLYNPEDIEVILGSSVHLNKSSEYSFFERWLGDGLLITSGNKWKFHRKLIAPTFHMSILKSFVPTFYKNSTEVCEKLSKEVGKTFDVHDYMSEATVDILLETAMGYKGRNKSDQSGFDYAMAVMKMCYITHIRHYRFWLRLEPIFKATKMSIEESKLLSTIHKLTRSVFLARKKEFEEKKMPEMIEVDETRDKTEESSDIRYVKDDLDDNDENDVGVKKRMAFLDMLMSTHMQDKNKFTSQEVQDEINTIMFEGHDTTAAGSSFALCVLGTRPDIQNKVMQELNGIFQGSDRACTYADTLEMKYLERVIMESLRLYPPVPLISREVREDVKLASGDFTIPANSTVIIVQYLMHRNAEYYPNPLEFDPDRFLPEACQKRHYYSFIPFSAGPRSCVGRKYAMLKLKVLLSTILRKYQVISDVPQSEFHLQADIILKRSNGFTLRLEERNKA